MVRHQAALAAGQLTRVTSGVNPPPPEVIMSRRHGNAERMCRESCSNAGVRVTLPRRTKGMESNMRISSIIAVGLLVTLADCATNQKVGEKDWFTAWGMSHNARATSPAISGRTVRMILMPSISGNSVRVKLENTMGEAPVVFSGAYIGVAGEGAAVQEKSITRLTFAGKPGLSLAAGQGAYSDPVPFKVNAFEKLSLSLDVQSAADISTHHVGLRTNWSAAGARASDPSAAGFEPLPEIPVLNTGQWPFYWVAALDVQ